MISISFRFDDPSEISDHELEKQIINLFKKYKAKINLAVIPSKQVGKDIFPLTGNKVAHLIDAYKKGVIDISLHGYSHLNNSNTSPPSEFDGISYDTQLVLIRKGMRILSEIFSTSVTGFVPPFNTYDVNTLKVLNAEKFEYISASRNTPEINAQVPIILPRSCNLKTVSRALSEAKCFHHLNPDIIVVLHHDDFEEFMDAENSDDHPAFTNLQYLEKILKQIKEDNELIFSDLAQLARKKKYQHSLRHIELMNWRKTVYWRFQKYIPEYILLTQHKWVIVYHITINVFRNKIPFLKSRM